MPGTTVFPSGDPGVSGAGRDWGQEEKGTTEDERARTVLTEKAMAPHSSTLAWRIPWTEEPGRLQPMGSLRVGHD